MKPHDFPWISEAINMLRAALATVVISFIGLASLQQEAIKSNISELDAVLNPIILKDLRYKIYGQPDLEVGKLLRKFTNVKQNPEELGTYFEGDILHPTGLQRNGLTDKSLRWINGIVPVELRGDFSAKELNTLNTAFEMYHNHTCVKFIRHSNEKDYITVTNKPTGCWSSLGRIGGRQVLNLQSPMCLYKVGTSLHELMHVLGFNHEHTREDRDEYVEIDWGNIPAGTYGNFGKALPNTTSTFEVEYDYESVLHYSPYAFAVNSSKPTIKALKQIRSERMGQRDGLSSSDIVKIWKMYKCTSTTQSSSNMK